MGFDNNMVNNHEDSSMEHALKRCLAPKYKLALIETSENGTIYSCVECQARYTQKEKLELHLCTHFNEYRFLCGICGTGLKRKEHLDRHTLGHREVRPHVCDDCGKGFKRKEHLNIHRSIHSGDKTHLCTLCHRSFYRKDHLQKHFQTHTKVLTAQNLAETELEFAEVKLEPAEEDAFLAEEDALLADNEERETEESMEVDEDNNSKPEAVAPKDPARPFECCICHKTYKRKDHLKLHSATHFTKDKVCGECGKAFHRDDQLLLHMHSHLQAFAQPQPQIKLEDEYGDMPTLFDQGMDILPIDESSLLIPRVQYGLGGVQTGGGGRGRGGVQTGDAEKRPHECLVCHRRFKRKQHLKVHANVHQKPLPTIWCSLCNEGFNNNDQFERHQCAGHAPAGGGGEGGDGGDEHTARAQDRKENHPYGAADGAEPSYHNEPIVSLVEESDIPTPQKVYVCKYCNKPFKRKDHYKIHLHIHTGIKSFFCPDCKKGFYRKDHLQKHLQVHAKTKPFALPRPPLPLPILSPPSPRAAAAIPAPKKKRLPDLFPINMLNKEVRPEITITAPSNSALRVPLQIKVPYQVVMSMDNGEQRAVTIDPNANTHLTVT